MSRVPLRLRLTAVFAMAMAAVVTGAGYLTLARFQEAQREYGPASVIGPVQQAAQQTGMDDLREELLISLPLVLIAATLGAYLLAAAALRPVEHMRAQAAAVTEDTPGQRLDVPPSRDEIARLSATLNTMLDRLQQALDHERRFVADASHELRTPLSLLRTELELALRRPRDATDLRAALASALEETVRLVDLTEDLLLLARTDRDKIHPGHAGAPAAVTGQSSGHGGGEGSDILLAPVLRRVVARQSAGPRDGRIAIDCPEDTTVAVVAVSVEQLERAVTNLVHNAVRHGREPVTLTARHTDGQVRILVRDHGPGFPAAFLPQAFDRFTRADPARSGPGSGLGLAITAAIARTAGGGYAARNHPGGGAEVWITLPAGHPAHPAMDHPTPS
ncbi:MAG TPA: HAMP domain-containing sensor histidine kinase [Kineosporiaceae bacterium]